jgi:hypothetical protein
MLSMSRSLVFEQLRNGRLRSSLPGPRPAYPRADRPRLRQPPRARSRSGDEPLMSVIVLPVRPSRGDDNLEHAQVAELARVGASRTARRDTRIQL